MVKSITRVGENEYFENEEYLKDQYKRTQPGNFQPRAEKKTLEPLPDVSKPQGLATPTVPPQRSRKKVDKAIEEQVKKDLRDRNVHG